MGITIEHVKNLAMALWVVSLGRRVRIRFPGAPRGRNGRVCAARRLVMIANNNDVRGTVAVYQIGQAHPIWPARHIAHGVSNLIFLAKRWAAGRRIDAIGAFENLLVSFNEWPD